MTTFGKISLKASHCPFNTIEYINLNLLRINKKHVKNTDIVAHEIKFITKQNIADQYINNELPLCFSDIRAYIIEENKDKYLVFALTENNIEELEMYKKLCSEIKKQIEWNSVECNVAECNSAKSIEYDKDPMKIKFDAYDEHLPLNKIL